MEVVKTLVMHFGEASNNNSQYWFMRRRWAVFSWSLHVFTSGVNDQPALHIQCIPYDRVEAGLSFDSERLRNRLHSSTAWPKIKENPILIFLKLSFSFVNQLSKLVGLLGLGLL